MSFAASQIMRSNLVTVQLMDDLTLAYYKMKQEGVRHLPVLDEELNIVGIISDRDFQRAMWPTERARGRSLSVNPILKPGAFVADYMSWPVRTLPHDTDLETVVKMLVDEKISAVLITEHQELSGIITHEDLLIVLSALLKQPVSIKDRVVEWTFRSPIGQVVSFLSNAGI